MRPYGRIKKIKGKNWKRNIVKYGNWWEGLNTIIPRTTLKSLWKKEIEKN